MGAGYYISGAGHGALILWIMVGGLVDRDHIEDIEAADVSLITEEQFAALLLPEAGVDASVPSPTVSAPAEDLSPDVPQAEAESAAEQTAPEPVAETEPEEVPDTPSKPEPVEAEPAPTVEPVAEPRPRKTAPIWRRWHLPPRVVSPRVRRWGLRGWTRPRRLRANGLRRSKTRIQNQNPNLSRSLPNRKKPRLRS